MLRDPQTEKNQMKNRNMKPFLLPLFSVVLLVSSIHSTAQSRIAIPSYQDPGNSQWYEWRTLGSSSVGIMIVNLDNGDDTTYYPRVDQAIRNTRKQGVFVVGYVYTGYGQRDPAVVRKKVDAVFRNYLVDGIFFDEVPTDCSANSVAGSNYRYYQDLADHVRSTQVGGRIVILNPGTQPNDDCWMSIANILVTSEANGLRDYVQNYQPESWFHRYPPERFWHIVYAVPSPEELNDVIALSLKRGAGWVYVTDRGSNNGNPYDKPPSYWSQEGAQIAQQGVQAPYAIARPRSSDSNGNPLPSQLSFRWGAVNGTKWQIFLDTDRDAHTGYQGSTSGLAIGADYLIEAAADGSARLLRYTGSGSDWAWQAVPVHARISFLDAGVNLIELDANALGQTHALDYQIRSLDADGKSLFTSLLVPLSLDSTAYVFDIENHSQN
jgi:Spherulation-specific family 4